MADDYRVGYGKPPKEHQFSKGLSGNPKGRPKGSKNRSLCIMDALNKTVTVREGNRTRTMTKLELILESTINKAAQGDAKARADVFKLMEKLERQEVANDKKHPSGVLMIPASPVDPEEWARAVAERQRRGREEG